MSCEKIKTYHKPIITVLVGGVALMPIQNALSHTNLAVSVTEFSAKVQSEQHAPHFDQGNYSDYYVDPRAIRAIGNDTGKSDQRRSGRENWDMY